MKNAYYLPLLLALISLCTGARAQGPKNALQFSGSQSVQSASVAHGIGTGEFTWEAWVKPNTLASSTCIMTNGNYAPGFYASTRGTGGDGSVGIYWGSWRNSGTAISTTKWSHVAVVRRADTLYFYINGILAPNKHTISGRSMANATFRLGWSGDAGEYMNGNIDEVRVWNQARSQEQIRSMMCRRLSGTETGLKQYYRLDEGGTDTATADAAGSYPLSKVGSGMWTPSGAAIGDTSVYAYPSSWTGLSLELSAAGRGKVVVDSITGTAAFAQLYQIRSVPSRTSGLTDYKDNDVYYGIYAPDTFRAYPKYEYSTYATAVANKATLRFFTRNSNADTPWTLKGAVYNNTTTMTMRVDSLQGARQLFLANFVSTCATPSALAVSGITATSAQLSWTSGGAALWNIQYDTAGFTPGSGIVRKGVNTNPFLLSGLRSATRYQYYVQDSCVGLGSSAWAGPFSFTTPVDPTRMGATTALSFNGAESIITDSVVKHNIGKNEFTYEAWIKPAKVSGSTGIMSNGSYAPCFYASTAGAGGDGSVGYYISGSWKNSGTFLSAGKWYHVAMVRYHDTITVYVNGVAAPKRYRSTDSLQNQKLTLGWSRDVSEYFQGDLDEVRVWSIARSEKELRDYMCQKLAGTESGLVNYYRLNEGSGTTSKDAAAAGRNLVTITPARWTVSGAALGDSATNLYASDWKGLQVSLNSATRGNLKIDSVSGKPYGIHVYRVDSIPNTVNGITTATGKGGYYGVFVAESSKLPSQLAHYNLNYDYTGYPDARTYESNIRLYNRSTNADTLWTDFWSVKNTGTHSFKVRDVMQRREALIGETAALSCAAPQSLHADTVKARYARIGFNGSPANWNVQYGKSGFVPGTGKLSTGTTLNPALLDSLESTAVYDVYIQQNCSGSSSKWSGPYSFITADLCPDPAALAAAYLGDDSVRLSWTTGGSATWNLEYGLSGYLPGSGVPVSGITTNPYTLHGLFASTGYDFYIQDTCVADVKASRWIGPVSVTTSPRCPAPTGLSAAYLGADSARLSWTSGGSTAWNIEYGVAGFTRGTGTRLATTGSATYKITGLLPATTYDFYVQDSCASVVFASKWTGPAQVSTSATGIYQPEQYAFTLYPNPANQYVSVRYNSQSVTGIEVLSLEGKLLRQVPLSPAAHTVTVPTDDLAPGVYMIRMSGDQLNTVSRLIITH